MGIHSMIRDSSKKMTNQTTTLLSWAAVAVVVILCFGYGVEAGTPLVGYGGNTFNEIFSTGFQNGLGGYGAGTVAGAIGYYGQFWHWPGRRWSGANGRQSPWWWQRLLKSYFG